PGTCGGYALAVRAEHFLATCAVTDDALPFTHPTAMQTNPTSALSNFTWANMVYPKAKHRGPTIAGLTVSVACIATKSAALCPSWVSRVASRRSRRSWHVRYASKSDPIGASQRSVAMCHKFTPSRGCCLYPVLKALPNDSLLKLNLTRQVVAPPNRQHPDKVFSAIVGGCECLPHSENGARREGCVRC